MKICTVVGARPQFIKSALVSRELKARGIEEVLIHTGQHYDYEMSQIFFRELKLSKAGWQFEDNKDTPVRHISRIIGWLEPIFNIEKPDKVLVYGDANATLAGAVAAVKMGIPVAHVEAGPRQGDMRIPEEQNRVITDHLAVLNFCPTWKCVDNLEYEGRQGIDVGDVMLDNYMHFSKKLKARHTNFILLTVHRPINTDNPRRLGDLVETMEVLNKQGHLIIWPMHPRTEKAMPELGGYGLVVAATSMDIVKPLSYKETLEALKGAKLVITDSGGLQKEAFFAKVPCITLDNSTPWLETVEAGWNVVTGVDRSKILEAVANPPRSENHDLSIFGDGKAHKRIVTALEEW